MFFSFFRRTETERNTISWFNVKKFSFFWTSKMASLYSECVVYLYFRKKKLRHTEHWKMLINLVLALLQWLMFFWKSKRTKFPTRLYFTSVAVDPQLSFVRLELLWSLVWNNYIKNVHQEKPYVKNKLRTCIDFYRFCIHIFTPWSNK